MKTVEELSIEIRLGLAVYHSAHPNMCVYYDTREVHDGVVISNYLFSFIPSEMIRSVSGREKELARDMAKPVLNEIGYETLHELIADWPIASQPLWGILEGIATNG